MVILLKPLVNEKSMLLIKSDFYTFVVDKRATKEQIARVVKNKYSVDVETVRTVTQKGKIKMQRSRKGYFKVSDTKKAIVKIKKGQKIAIFEQVDAEKDTQEVEVRTAEGEVIAKTTEKKEKKSLLKGIKVTIEKDNKKKESK